MVRVYAPALSVDASGTLAKSMVFSKWKGRNYVRKHVNPSQPRTSSQIGVRRIFSFLAKIWASISTANKATWLVLAKQMNVSEFNAFMKYNQQRWRNFLGPTKVDPATEASGAASVPTSAVTVGIRQLTIALTHGATPPDWGYMIFRGLTGFMPAFSNCVYVGPFTAATDMTWVDTPLVPGTYYYRARGFNVDGKLGTLEAEFSGTVV